jgi:hypothetical protein
MGTRLILDEEKYRQFMEENSNWKNTIKEHATEIPAWEKMLAAALDKKEKKKSVQKEIPETTATDISTSVFSGQLLQQHKEMIELHDAIVAQEKRLKDSEAKKEHDIESLNTQALLRDRIKEIEKSYLELKGNFMKYFSTIL